MFAPVNVQHVPHTYTWVLFLFLCFIDMSYATIPRFYNSRGPNDYGRYSIPV